MFVVLLIHLRIKLTNTRVSFRIISIGRNHFSLQHVRVALQQKVTKYVNVCSVLHYKVKDLMDSLSTLSKQGAASVTLDLNPKYHCCCCCLRNKSASAQFLVKL